MVHSAKSAAVFSFAIWLAAAAVACGGDSDKAPAPTKSAKLAPVVEKQPTKAPEPDLGHALVLGLASFAPFEKGKPPKALPARMEFLSFSDGKWNLTQLEDEGSDVFHKAMAYQTADGQTQILSVSGSKAVVKLWSKGADGLEAKTLWEKDFGGKFSRMRDVEVGDLFGDGSAAMAVATHDQGIVATIHPKPDGTFEVVEIDAEPDTFVHEIEIGDLDGDGTLEVYATPSEPNRLDGSHQSGQVARYIPKTGEGRKIVADLGDRHAKEIYVGDVDGNGKDELYVVVEGRLNKETKSIDVKTEVRRYEADTDPAAGVVIGELPDYMCRFLTVGVASSTQPSCPTSTETEKTSSTSQATSTRKCVATSGTARGWSPRRSTSDLPAQAVSSLGTSCPSLWRCSPEPRLISQYSHNVLVIGARGF